jgi:uncharacterized membrane protein YraQ (UPF0718 family)
MRQGTAQIVVGDHLLDALAMTGSMAWQIAWSLILGFTLSAIVQPVVRREAIVRHLGDDSPGALMKATGLGAASSSCSFIFVDATRRSSKEKVPSDQQQGSSAAEQLCPSTASPAFRA